MQCPISNSPTQALSLMHLGADVEAYWPGNGYRFRPVPVVSAWGRAAALPPKCPVKECIYDWWKAPGPETLPCSAFVHISESFYFRASPVTHALSLYPFAIVRS